MLLRSTHKLNVPVSLVIAGKTIQYDCTVFFKEYKENQVITVHQIYGEYENNPMSMEFLLDDSIYLDVIYEVLKGNRPYWRLIHEHEDKDWHGIELHKDPLEEDSYHTNDSDDEY